MSLHADVKRITVPQLCAYKDANQAANQGARKIVALTAFTSAIARVIDPYLDLILVGDSTAMVGYGLPDTLSITVEQLTHHAAAVVRATQRACVVVDMPFGSYQESPQQAFANAARMLAGSGASAVKLEGGAALADTVRFLVERGIPVLAHVGLMPQFVHTMGGYRAQGMNDDSAALVRADALAHQTAGAFGVVLEGVSESIAAALSKELAMLTIGIGASPACDGQILVTEDILGLTPRPPRFAKRYADLDAAIGQAVAHYADDVREGRFPELGWRVEEGSHTISNIASKNRPSRRLHHACSIPFARRVCVARCGHGAQHTLDQTLARCGTGRNRRCRTAHPEHRLAAHQST